MDQARAPVLEALAEYRRSGRTSYASPGHRLGSGTDPRVRDALGEAVFHSDLPIRSGLDDRAASGGVLEQAQRLMADAVGAEHSVFCRGGSPALSGAVLALAGPQRPLLVDRTAAARVADGLIVSGAQPVWVEPEYDAASQPARPATTAAFEAALEQCPQARGAVIASPTSYGTCADIAGIADACHRHGCPLLVDQTLGAHLPFHPALPAWAMTAGADVCVAAAPATGAVLGQGSVLHQQGSLVDAALLRHRAALLGGACPPAAVCASLDGWRRQMVEHGQELLGDAMTLAGSVRDRIDDIHGLSVGGQPGRAAGLDPLLVLVDVSGLGTTGYRVADWLREHRRITVHLADHRRISVRFTHADHGHAADRLLMALRDLARQANHLPPGGRIDIPGPGEPWPEQVVRPREAFLGRTERVPARHAVDRVAAETLAPYPQGIPAVLPGQRLTPPVVAHLCSAAEAGMVTAGGDDPRLEAVRVLLER